MNVFTGATGSTGRYIDEGFVPLRTRLECSQSEMEAELRGLGAGISSFIHLAALVPTGDCEANPDRARELNVEGAKRWFLAARNVGVSHFVFASSSHVYGRVEPGKFVDTDHPTNPVNIYGRLKLEAESELLRLSKLSTGTKLTIARIFSILSDAMRPGFLLTGLHARAAKGDLSPIPGLSATRDFMTAQDVARDLVRVAKWQNAPDIVHICSGKPRQIVEIVRDVFNEYGLPIQGITEADPGPNNIPWLVGVPSLPHLEGSIERNGAASLI